MTKKVVYDCKTVNAFMLCYILKMNALQGIFLTKEHMP